MKGRLITNGVLSLLASVFALIAFALLVSMSGEKHYDNLNQWNTAHEKDVKGKIGVSVLLLLAAGALMFASFIMGIVTLSTEKSEHARGLTIASGILGILSGFFGAGIAGCIVSFIGVYKINKAEKENN